MYINLLIILFMIRYELLVFQLIDYQVINVILNIAAIFYVMLFRYYDTVLFNVNNWYYNIWFDITINISVLYGIKVVLSYYSNLGL